jgi:DNA polymerase I
MNPLLVGHSPDERIVAIQHLDDSTMRLYIRGADGVATRDERFFPFFHLSDAALIEGFERRHWVRKLEGTGYYQFLCVFEEWQAMWDAIRHCLERHNRETLPRAESHSDLTALHLSVDPVTQFLLQSGRTLFKGMELDDLHRMQIDIETYTGQGHRFSAAERPSDRIILIAVTDNRGLKQVIDGRKTGEKQMLSALVRLVHDKDPDVIEGHNILGFDFPYLITRAEMLDVPFAIGRDGSAPKVSEQRPGTGERGFDSTFVDIAGRHVIDTLLLVQNHDAQKRTMEGYGLKYAAQYFGLSSPDRTMIPGDRISWHWDHDPAPLLAYALDDAEETRRLAEHLAPTSFYLTQMVPLSFGAIVRSGSAAKIEHLMVREYLRVKHALPRPREGAQTTGGYTDIFLTGILGPIVHADVESLYPSIMLTRAISPSTDALGIYGDLLKELTGLRLDTKRRMKEESDAIARSRLDAMQSSLKILINSFYGYLGYSRALFNDYARADEVTRTGQTILRHMMQEITARGGKVVEVDTDGVFFVPPQGIDDQQAEEQFVAQVSDTLPEGITVVVDGRYRKMYSYKKKNYALLEYDQRIRIKGSSLISRSMERFGRTFIRDGLGLLLEGDIQGVHDLYARVRNAVQAHELDVRDFCRVEVLRDSLREYEEDVQAGRRNKSAAYVVALASGRPVRPGDRIAYYITGSDPTARGFENCKAAEEWDSNFPDENVPYYLRRLEEFTEKFQVLLTTRDFQAVFTSDELFPFSAKGITLVISESREGEEGGQPEPPAPSLGIWLDE